MSIIIIYSKEIKKNCSSDSFNNIPIKILPANTSSYIIFSDEEYNKANKMLIKEARLQFCKTVLSLSKNKLPLGPFNF